MAQVEAAPVPISAMEALVGNLPVDARIPFIQFNPNKFGIGISGWDNKSLTGAQLVAGAEAIIAAAQEAANEAAQSASEAAAQVELIGEKQDLIDAGIWDAQAAAAQAMQASGFVGAHSTTAMVPGTGSKSFTLTELDVAFQTDQFVIAISDAVPSAWMLGQITAFIGQSLTIGVTDIGPGTGSHSDWKIMLSSPRGPAGANGLGDLSSANNLSELTNKRLAKDNISLNTTVTAAATTDLENATGDVVSINGNTTINAITLAAGHQRVTRFNGSPILTNSGTLILPGNADIPAAPGDVALWAGFGGGVVCTGYLKANGTTLATKTASLAGAATVDLGSTNAQFVLITAPASSITSLGTTVDGTIKFVQFQAAHTLVNSGNIVCLGNEDIPVANGDLAIFRFVGNWRMVAYSRVSARPLNVKFDTIAAAATTDLASKLAQSLSITGTGQTITSFGSSGLAGEIKACSIAAGNILTHSATLNLPGAQNITTGTNDTFIAKQDAVGTWRVLSYMAGSTGDFLESDVASPGSTATNGVSLNVTSLTLTPGIWLVWGNIGCAPSVQSLYMRGGFSTTSATLPTGNGLGGYSGLNDSGLNIPAVMSVGMRRFSVSANTQVFLVGRTGFSSGTNSMFGYMAAQRLK